ncbi:MAG: hypothetical protein K0S65_6225, partial [Labilithrix sp.]|nr:hypothetical protein [Labilithrix sp.]
LLLGEGEPRMPTLGADGVVQQHVRFWHAESGPVAVERVVVTSVEEHGGRERSTRRELSAGSTLGATHVPPGAGIVASLRLDTRARPDVVYETYELVGRDASGRPAHGSFTLMVPLRPPSATHGTAVTAAPLTERIVRAQRLLGKPYVTRRDLDGLEQKGAFADLTPLRN